MVNVPPGFLELLLCRMVFVTSSEMHKIASLAAGQSPRFRASHRRASPTWLASAGRVHDEVSDGALAHAYPLPLAPVQPGSRHAGFDVIALITMSTTTR